MPESEKRCGKEASRGVKTPLKPGSRLQSSLSSGVTFRSWIYCSGHVENVHGYHHPDVRMSNIDRMSNTRPRAHGAAHY